MLAARFEAVTFAYREQNVLFDATFSIRQHSLVGIVGPNGGGKTTLMRLLLGFLAPQSGKVEIFGRTPQDARQELAYVPQAIVFDRSFPLSVYDLVLQGRLANLSWLGTYSRQDHECVAEAIAQVGLQGLEDRTFSALSGGQLQRALIARALASKPKLLLLDEPTANIDQEASAEIYSLLRSLKGQMTIVMVTHHLRAVLSDLDEILYVERSVSKMHPNEICDHFAMGLYHPPQAYKLRKRESS